MTFQKTPIALILTFLALPVIAEAQATRTWVSGVGDDVNPCSRTAPCKTFAGAISKTAAGGVISVLDPGGFGAVTITKSITIDGGGIEGSIIGSLVNGIIININSTMSVTIRNLGIYGVGNGLSGIRILGDGNVSIEGVEISGFNIGIDNVNNAQVYVSDAFVHHNRQFGALLRVGRGTFDNVRFENNDLDGLRVSVGGRATVRRSTAAGNTNIGFSAVDAGSRLMIEDCVVNANVFGIGAALSGAVTVSNSTVSHNSSAGLTNDGSGSLFSFGNNRFAFNTADGSFNGSATMQ